MIEYKKDFDKWNILKKTINQKDIIHSNNSTVMAKNRDLWWCHIGINIGSEQDGKNDEFERPVLILNKLSSNTYLVTPTTSKCKDNKYRVRIETKNNKYSFALLDQIKVIDYRRLKRKIGVVKESDFNKVTNELTYKILNCELPHNAGVLGALRHCKYSIANILTKVKRNLIFYCNSFIKML